ncbi:MAG TPA: YdcF family protein [Stellaceae bacterium]|nr:YdcF family protein [Stellaceae bacterium]
MLFQFSKLAWALLQPDLVIFALIVIGVGLLWTRWARGGRRLATLGSILLVMLIAAPVSDWLYAPLETRFPPVRAMPPHVDGIVALGGAIDPIASANHDMPSLNEEAERLTTFAMLARRYPAAKLVFTAGSAAVIGERLPEADAARQLFTELGLDTTKIIFERKSRNTYENALFSKRLADPKPGEVWILITSAWHMPRAVGIFRQAGWPVLPWPVAYRTGASYDFELVDHLRGVDRATHEWLGLLAYRLLGRTDALFPGP